MRLFVFFVILLAVLVSGCTTRDITSDLSNLKNPALEFSWEFNDSLTNEYGDVVGGSTLNSSYFQLRKYNQLDEFSMNFYKWFCGKVPYQINYKHEEGHIFTSQLLKIDNYDEFEYSMFNSSNLTDYNNFRINFSIPVSEGISDYYAISYFKDINDSLGNNYFNCIENCIKNNYQCKQHYQGIIFVQYSLNNKLYSNLTDLILDLDSIRQYNYYKEFAKTLPDGLTVY